MNKLLIVLIALSAVAFAAVAQYTPLSGEALGATTPGAVASATTQAAAETRAGIMKTVITLDDQPVHTIEGGASTNGVGSAKIYDFPAGRICVLGVLVEDFTITVDANDLDEADGGDFALGSAVATNAGASGMAGTEVDLCPSTSVDPLAATNITDAALGAEAQWDGTATALDMYLNIEVDDGDISAKTTNLVDATVTINWINLGDY